jgi:hypothetical protein
MAAYYVISWQLRDYSRVGEFVALATEFKPIGTRLGAVDQRLYQPVTATGDGPNLTLTYTAELPDMAAAGAWVGNLLTDPEVQAWVAKATAPNAPAVVTLRGFATDLPF